MTTKATTFERLIYARTRPIIGRVIQQVLAGLYGAEIPAKVAIGEGLSMAHRGHGTIVHPGTMIGRRVTLFPGVLLGRGDVEVPSGRSDFAGIIVEDDVILGAGAKVIGGAERLVIRRGTVVAANAVLRSSTGEWEVWGGIPARKLSVRECRSGTTSESD